MVTRNKISMNRAEEFYDKAYDILVKHGCASPSMRETFIDYFTQDSALASTLEWRFQGKFGFGGKFWRVVKTVLIPSSGHSMGVWRTERQHSISYYPEDHTKKLDKLAIKINEKLKLLETSCHRI